MSPPGKPRASGQPCARLGTTPSTVRPSEAQRGGDAAGHATGQQDQRGRDMAQASTEGRRPKPQATSVTIGDSVPAPPAKPLPLGQPPQEASRAPPHTNPKMAFLLSPATSESNGTCAASSAPGCPRPCHHSDKTYACDPSMKSKGAELPWCCIPKLLIAPRPPGRALVPPAPPSPPHTLQMRRGAVRRLAQGCSWDLMSGKRNPELEVT